MCGLECAVWSVRSVEGVQVEGLGQSARGEDAAVEGVSRECPGRGSQGVVKRGRRSDNEVEGEG